MLVSVDSGNFRGFSLELTELVNMATMAQHMQKIKKRFKVHPIFIELPKRSQRHRWRQITALSLAILLTAGCSNPFDDEPEVRRGTIGFVSGALGVISVQEPQSAIVARDILSAGGTAAVAGVAAAAAVHSAAASAAYSAAADAAALGAA